MASPEQQLDTLREGLSRVILDQLAETLRDYSSGNLANPVLRFEAFIQDGEPGTQGHSPRSAVVSKMVDLSGIISQSTTNSPNASSIGREHAENTTPPAVLPQMFPEDRPASSSSRSMSLVRGTQRTPSLGPLPLPLPPPPQPPHHQYHQTQYHHPSPEPSEMVVGLGSHPRRGTGALRPVRAGSGRVLEEEEEPHSQRRMQVASNFPKRAKTAASLSSGGGAVFVPQQSSIEKFVVSIWEQIHGGISLDPQSLLEQWQLTATAATATINNAGKIHVPEQLELGLLQAPTADGLGVLGPGSGSGNTTTTTATLAEIDMEGTFNRSNIFCRKVTQASRACRSIEVIVQARWIEHFDSYVELLAMTNPGMSPTKRRKAALIEACNDFGWSEKELRNKMAIWRGYKEIKDAGGWAALVFAGMGLYRFCKYRVGFNTESMQRLRCLRPRIEVAADTLHPTWRQLLMIVGEPAHRRFSGHPHDWVVRQDGSDPVPLRSTYLEYDPYFSFEQLEHSVMDMSAWGSDDPRWVPPMNTVACVQGKHTCHSCGQEQSEDPKVNSCYCFPTLFGSGSRSPCPVQVFRTPDGRNNGLMALCPFERGAAIGEFVGLVTKDLQNMDVMDSSTGVRAYQIWQGRQGNFTRFVNHSCKANAQFQQFVWMSTQRIVLVSKGIEAGREVTVDYSGSYWRGLDKDCLCGESCCRYRGTPR
ncbi:SET domain-containing protein [Colletotrichum higginsianum IMI 349063]|uniref:SET domain-containing protein n=2 Tax=Colletotrichum higginsianum TaxID=80884 RepID=A0A1B7YSX3_COLHI|nr:SET domain-containing protein [Colletotrichum higginsianum IMI 349063]OBR15136.1 SET domain-containing protein [Colletotrichum higginsianum IMI 349063]TID04136.1 SET domain-containing protein [Colletotrichum higginsianum]